MSINNSFFSRRPHESKTEAVTVESPGASFGQAIVSTLLATGFTSVHKNATAQYFVPCPVGTFSNYSSQGTEGCIKCPPGILNQSTCLDS